MPPEASNPNGYDPTADLAKVAAQSQDLRMLEQRSEIVRGERRDTIARLRAHDVTVRRIADACGVTEGAIQATLRVKRT